MQKDGELFVFYLSPLVVCIFCKHLYKTGDPTLSQFLKTPKISHEICTIRPKNTNTLGPPHTPALSSPWHSASFLQGQNILSASLQLLNDFLWL